MRRHIALPALATAILLSLAGPASAQQHRHSGHAQPARDADAHSHHVAPSPLPSPTAAERAAAFPADFEAMDMRAHMDDDPWVAALRVDRLERDDDDGEAWQLRASLARSERRLVLSSEGRRSDGAMASHALEARWQWATGPWWDALVAVRDARGGDRPSRQWVGIGASGIAPYRVHVDAVAYLGSGGRVAARIEADYDLLLSNRLKLSPKIEAWLHGDDDRATGIGRGLSEVDAGLRLRYEVTPRFAPYAGYAWSRKFGRSAEFARDAGGPAADGRWVFGVRGWF